MTNNKLFIDPFVFSRDAIGFDNFFNKLTQANSSNAWKNVATYPPYNIRKIDDNNYSIDLAIAGFGKQNLDIELQDGVLIVKGEMNAPDDESTYLYKGISTRAFTRKFTLADTIVVKDAHIINGILKIMLENIIPDSKKPKKIQIGESENSSEKTFLQESNNEPD